MSTLRITTYNTHLFAGTALPWIRPQLIYRDDERGHEIVQRLLHSESDIVGLCEVWARAMQRRLSESLKAHLPHVAHDDAGSGSMGSGLLLLSRYSIDQSTFVPFDDAAGPESFSGKGFLYALCRIEDMPHRVVLTHTQADDGGTSYRSVRAKNLSQIHRYLESHHSGLPTLLMGDLNVPAHDTDQYDDLLRTFDGYSDCWTEASAGYTCDPRSNTLAAKYDCHDDSLGRAVPDAPARFDYVFARELAPVGAQVPHDWKIDSDDCSDHWPLQVVLRPQVIAASSSTLKRRYPQMVSTFDDRGSGASTDLQVFQPKDGSLPWVAQVASPDYGPFPHYSLAFSAASEGLWAPPLRFECIWRNDGGSSEFTCWRPIAPTGFRALGHVIAAGTSSPKLTSFVCLREDLCSPQPAELGTVIWSDEGTWASSNLRIHRIRSRPGEVSSNAFVGISGSDDATGVYNLRFAR